MAGLCGKQSSMKLDNLDVGADHDMGQSLLYSLLPTLLQRRVPMIPSLRRAASTYAAKSGRHITASSEFSETSSVTPPPSYWTSARTSYCGTDHEEPTRFWSAPSSRPSSSLGRKTLEVNKQEVERGVKWKYARQGYALLSLSTQEAGIFDDSADFSRKLYVDGLEYLLRGLPSELSEEEQLGLRSALPDDLLSQAPDHTLPEAPSPLTTTSSPPAPPSLLHRTIATLTLTLFLLLSFLLPYIHHLLQCAYRYDRKHQISERVLAQAMAAANAMGQRTRMLVGNGCAMQEGRFGEAVRNLVVWWVRGVSGGVFDGVGEGMEAVASGTGRCRR